MFARWLGMKPADVDHLIVQDFIRLRDGIEEEIRQEEAAARDRG
jgi:hypothetical protein